MYVHEVLMWCAQIHQEICNLFGRFAEGAFSRKESCEPIAQRHTRGFPVESPREVIQRKPTIHGAQPSECLRFGERLQLLERFVLLLALLRPERLRPGASWAVRVLGQVCHEVFSRLSLPLEPLNLTRLVSRLLHRVASA
eukprot:15852-Pyramimonas_sp.AAC.2